MDQISSTAAWLESRLSELSTRVWWRIWVVRWWIGRYKRLAYRDGKADWEKDQRNPNEETTSGSKKEKRKAICHSWTLRLEWSEFFKRGVGWERWFKQEEKAKKVPLEREEGLGKSRASSERRYIWLTLIRIEYNL